MNKKILTILLTLFLLSGGNTFAQNYVEPDLSIAHIISGTIDGTVIGGTTPAAGTFTELHVDTTTINGGSITDSSGAINFDNENLDTNGDMDIGGTTYINQAIVNGEQRMNYLLSPAVNSDSTTMYWYAAGGALGVDSQWVDMQQIHHLTTPNFRIRQLFANGDISLVTSGTGKTNIVNAGISGNTTWSGGAGYTQTIDHLAGTGSLLSSGILSLNSQNAADTAQNWTLQAIPHATNPYLLLTGPAGGLSYFNYLGNIILDGGTLTYLSLEHTGTTSDSTKLWFRADQATSNQDFSVQGVHHATNPYLDFYSTHAGAYYKFDKAITSSGIVTGTQLTSNVATGTPPLVVTSTTNVPNLNASYIDSLTSTNLRSFSRGQVINTIKNALGANLIGLWVFNPTTGTTILDLSGNALDATTTTDISAMTPGFNSLAPRIKTAAQSFSMADSASFTFAAPNPFSIVTLMLRSGYGTQMHILSKYDATTASPQREWRFYFGADNLLYGNCMDAATNNIGRKTTATYTDTTNPGVYSMTYSGGTTNAAIKLYFNGTQVDTTDSGAGVFTTMADTTATPGSFIKYTDGSKAYINNAYYSVMILTNSELTLLQEQYLYYLLGGYAGIL